MTIPHRGSTGNGTYFVTASTYKKQSILQSDRMAALLINVLSHYQEQQRYLLHEFVIMPDHFHVLITPAAPTTIERAVQFIKGGFSFRARKEFGILGDIWQTSFYDRRVRDAYEYSRFRHYIHMNPVKRGLTHSPEEFAHSWVRIKLDEIPQRLKPLV